MSSYHYVLWIPQVKKKEPCVICPQLEEKVLCDIDILPPLYVRGQILSDSCDIVLNYSIEKKLLDKTLIFNYIKSDDRGFVIYKLDLNEQQTDFLCERLRMEMPNALYHYFKSFFHRHVFHDDSVDSLLRPYTSSAPIKWDDTNVRNEIVGRLIADYERKFNGECKMHSRNYEKIVEKLEKGYKIVEMHDRMGRLYEHEKNTLNERTFCNFLMRSFPCCVSADRKRLLKETIAHLEVLTLKSESSFSKISTSLGLGYSMKGYYVGIGGLLFGCISTAWSLWYSTQQANKSSTEQKEYQREIIDCIQNETAGLKADEQFVLEQVHQINNRMDTLNYRMNKIIKRQKK